ncbi:MAG: copper chaperone PCu(A)C [Chloroflexaceae bacterium]|nr:copper chaperone PCu(A)C [Chloroflexaceae bacterium]
MGKNMLLIGVMVVLLSGCIRTSAGANGEPSVAAPTDEPVSTVETGATEVPDATAVSEPETAPDTAGAIEIRDLWVRATVGMVMPGGGPGGGRGQAPGQGGGRGQAPGQGGTMVGSSTSAVFMTMVNPGDTADALVGVATDAAETVELVSMQPLQQQVPVEQIELPAGGEVVLDQGPGYHIFLSHLTRDLVVGDTVDLTLTFEHAGEVEVTAPVQVLRQGRP